jgi:hypothetical protein
MIKFTRINDLEYRHRNYRLRWVRVARRVSNLSYTDMAWVLSHGGGPSTVFEKSYEPTFVHLKFDGLTCGGRRRALSWARQIIVSDVFDTMGALT